LIFSELYDRLERARWDMSDIPFKEIDKTKVDEGMIHDIKHITLTELGSLPATRMFIRDFKHDIDFQRFINVWSFEEGKHSLALQRWLENLGVELKAPEMQKVDIEFETAPWIETLTMHFLGEQRLGMWYASFAGFGPGSRSDVAVEEPVLRHILKLMAQDEWRHAGCYFAFLKKYIDGKKELLENVGKMSMWMLRGRYRHPTNITEPSVMGQLEDPEYFTVLIDRYTTPASEKAMEQRVLNCFSILSGETIENMKELLRYLKNNFGNKVKEEVPA
jgi:hypothetical protein